MICFNKTPLQLWNGKALRRARVNNAYRVMLHNCFSRCSRPIGMDELSYKNSCKVACHAHELKCLPVINKGFSHPRDALSTNRNSETVRGIYDW